MARAVFAGLAPGGGGRRGWRRQGGEALAFGGEKLLFFLEDFRPFLAMDPDVDEVLALLRGGFLGDFVHGQRFLLLQGLETGGLRGAGGQGAIGGVGGAAGIGGEGGELVQPVGEGGLFLETAVVVSGPLVGAGLGLFPSGYSIGGV